MFSRLTLILDSQLACSSLETISPAPSIPPLSVSLCRVEVCGLFPMHFGMSVVSVLAQLHFSGHVGEIFMEVASCIIRRHNLTPNF